ncbi:type II toxin-antitoxin system HicA family toxin [Candidatus Peregrinibacteria bacterium]|nr:MAG: type II toxin-antitoxin system HicA family toxin [Candidatus Peregrinibacteria bacterium]
MPKLPTFNSKELIGFLEKIGFVIRRTSGSHVILFNEKKKRRAVVPFHKKELPRGTLHSILKEAGVSKKDL